MGDHDNFGFCPTCRAPGVARERRLDGDDHCVNGHTYPSCSALASPVFDYGQKRPDGQHERHPSLPPEARQQFVRPVRTKYRHIGCRPAGPTRPLTVDEAQQYEKEGYTCFEEYPVPPPNGALGRFWTERQLRSGCGEITNMGMALAETYAVRPSFYGRTFCSGCHDYFPVGADGEFVWIERDGSDGTRVGT